jgi:phosphonate transport system permease protein
MAQAVARLPDAQAAPLLLAYSKAKAARRWASIGAGLALLVLILASSWVGEVDLFKLWHNLPRLGSYLGRLAYLDDGRLVLSDPAEWFWGLSRWLKRLGDTLLMAYLGTLIGAVLAFSACFLASRNLVGSPALLFFVRRGLELLRSVPTLVFALMFVIAFGLGPFPGVLAIVLHSCGALGKQFMELVENIDMKPVTGVEAAGGGFWQIVRYGVVPQVASNFAGYTLLRFEINVRESAVMGFVGAGGIGEDLLEVIRKFYYSDVSAILVLIVVTVMVIDMLSGALRRRLIGQEQRS